jgi:hypothetical protein
MKYDFTYRIAHFRVFFYQDNLEQHFPKVMPIPYTFCMCDLPLPIYCTVYCTVYYALHVNGRYIYLNYMLCRHDKLLSLQKVLERNFYNTVQYIQDFQYFNDSGHIFTCTLSELHCM